MTPEYYRGEAERCRRLAQNQPDRGAAEQLDRMAGEYEALARELEGSPASSPQSQDAR
jgi:hypothetical protein